MNKAIATAAIVGAAILSPVASMGITPVREALLGLAPEDQIVALADKIDENRAENDQKSAENETKISELQTLISAQQSTIDEQKKALENANIQIAQTTSKINTELVTKTEITAKESAEQEESAKKEDESKIIREESKNKLMEQYRKNTGQ
jgi:hypothetical protein